MAVLDVSLVVDEALADSLRTVLRERLGGPLLEELGDVGLIEQARQRQDRVEREQYARLGGLGVRDREVRQASSRES